MKTVLMAFSAATPAILFSFLLLKFNIQAVVSSQKLNPGFPVSTALKHVFEQHFNKLVAVEIQGKHYSLNGFVDARSDGTYRLLTKDRDLILIVKKSKVGWAIIQKGNNETDPSEYLLPLILLLENKFYN